MGSVASCRHSGLVAREVVAVGSARIAAEDPAAELPQLDGAHAGQAIGIEGGDPARWFSVSSMAVHIMNAPCGEESNRILLTNPDNRDKKKGRKKRGPEGGREAGEITV